MISKILQILGLQPQISKSFYRSLEHFFLTVGQNNFGNKITINNNYQTENPNVFEHFKGIPYKIGQYSQAIQVTLKVGDSTQSFWVWKWACSRIHTIRLVSTLEVYYELQDWSLTLASMPLAGVGIGQLNICLTTLDFQNLWLKVKLIGKYQYYDYSLELTKTFLGNTKTYNFNLLPGI